MMKTIHTVDKEKCTTMSFDLDQILKIVMAQQAMHRLSSENYRGISQDNRTMLNMFAANGYIYICSRMMGYIASYDMTDIDNGFLTLEIMLPQNNQNQANILRRKIETALSSYILSEIYRTDEHSSSLSEYYSNTFKCQLKNLISEYA
ncbi:MAG: hypothetical protein PHR45_03540 [Muribaculaceae bacterium]|nr:hypothetical protein [Muribaculaceae bacterium]